MVASHFDRFEIVRLLIEHGVDVNAVSRTGSSALWLARLYGNTGVVALLEKHEGK